MKSHVQPQVHKNEATGAEHLVEGRLFKNIVTMNGQGGNARREQHMSEFTTVNTHFTLITRTKSVI